MKFTSRPITMLAGAALAGTAAALLASAKIGGETGCCGSDAALHEDSLPI